MKKVALRVLLISVFLGGAQAQPIEELFGFLEDCQAHSSPIYYDLYEDKLVSETSSYFTADKYKTCALEGYDPEVFKVLCVDERYYSLPVNKIILPVSNIALYGIVLDVPYEQALEALKGKAVFKPFLSGKEEDYFYWKGMISKVEQTQTMLSCEVEVNYE